VFVTNNSTKSRADYKKKFDKMGITASEVCWDTSPSNQCVCSD
jgi:ribonucleotide monophosphatase NagD (HAD superfamily)